MIPLNQESETVISRTNDVSYLPNLPECVLAIGIQRVLTLKQAAIFTHHLKILIAVLVVHSCRKGQRHRIRVAGEHGATHRCLAETGVRAAMARAANV